MTETDMDILRQGLFEAIEIQMHDGTPPETKRTFDRLVGEGYSKEDTMALIARVLVSEMSRMLENEEDYDEERYVGALNSLPAVPPDS